MSYEIYQNNQWVPAGIASEFNHSDQKEGIHSEEAIINKLNTKYGATSWRPVEIWTDNSPCENKCQPQLRLIIRERCANRHVPVHYAAIWEGHLAQYRHPLIRAWWE